MLGKVDAVITDPPFEQQAHTAMRRTQSSIRTGEKAALDFAPITEDLRKLIPSWAAQNCDGWLLAFCQVEAVSDWRYAMEEAGLKYKRGMAWVKPDSSPQFNGQMPAQGFECIATAWCGKGHSRWNGGGRRGVFTHNTNSPDRHGLHPTEKPVSLMSELVTLFTDDGATILDPFMGSGSTGCAAVINGRDFIGIELDEKYFAVAVKRITEAHRQQDLFIDKPAPVKMEQGQLL
jgi:DNA modification methylase